MNTASATRRAMLFTIDFETTGKDPLASYPIEVGLASPDDGAFTWERFIALPEGETIPPETSAVHHIIDSDLEGAGAWHQVLVQLAVQTDFDSEDPTGPDSPIFVAHNADYERGVLSRSDFSKARWICTYKAALRVWPDAPTHSNEGLRYWLQLGNDRGRRGATGAHSALHDAKVTAAILNGLLDAGASIEDMIAWSNEPRLLKTCPFGKHRGQPWADIPQSYFDWVLKQPDMEEDIKWNIRRAMMERRGMPQR